MTSLSLPPPRKAPVAPTTTLDDDDDDADVSNTAPSIRSARSGVATATTTTNTSSRISTGGGVKRAVAAQNKRPPPPPPSYEERCRAAAALSKMPPEERRKTKLFVPRSLQDFGEDGGAYPEIHVAQYPRHMGNPHLKKKRTTAASTATSSSAKGGGPGPVRGAQSTSSTAIVNVEIDSETGKVSYDAIVKGGTNSDKKVYTKLQDLKGGPAKAEDIALPTEEEEQAEAAKTQAALNAILAQKTALDKPSGSAMQNAKTSSTASSNTQFIKYTPRPDAPGYNPAAAQRVIQMVPAQVDPMMPPKHKHLKAPRGPAEDPVPVLHAPPTKLSKEEREAWNIPACISNWKNTRGYTIPLDKRLAADGRGLQEHSINDNFGTLSESLYVAERQARQEVRMRATVQKKLALQEKEKRQEELRQLANQARLERGGGIIMPTAESGGGGGAAAAAAAAVAKGGGGSFSDTDDDDESAESVGDRGGRRKEQDDGGTPERRRPPAVVQEKRPETEEDVAARQREKLRVERKREREKEMRFEKTQEAKKKRLEEERDVSEKIALGVYTGSGGDAGGAGGDVDSRLYNQSGGMDTGFGAEDDYNTYTKPMFDREPGASSSIYRPTRGETEYNADDQYKKLVDGSTSKFAPDKGFAGAEGGGDVRAGPRTAPVQFEKGGQK